MLKLHIKNTKLSYKNKSKSKEQEFSGGLVKCYNKKVTNRYRSKSTKRFIKKVKKAMLEDVPRQTALSTYSWKLLQNSSGSTGIFAQCWWWQFALDYVNNSDTATPVAFQLNGNDAPNVQPGLFCWQNTGVTANSGGTLVAPSTTLVDTITTDTSPNMAGTNASLEKMYSSMQVTLKNTSERAYILEIFTVRPKRRQNSDYRENYPNSWGVWNGALDAYRCGLAASTTSVGNVNITGTLGAASAAITNCQASQIMNTSLNDSIIFNQNYKITKRCKVYLASGGMLQKSLVHKGMRKFNTRYLYDTKEDRGTEYLIFKAYPEPLSSPGQVGTETASVIYENQTSGPIIGYVNWRYTFKQIQNPTTNALQHYEGGIPVSASQYVIGGQAVNTHQTT